MTPSVRIFPHRLPQCRTGIKVGVSVSWGIVNSFPDQPPLLSLLHLHPFTYFPSLSFNLYNQILGLFLFLLLTFLHSRYAYRATNLEALGFSRSVFTHLPPQAWDLSRRSWGYSLPELYTYHTLIRSMDPRLNSSAWDIGVSSFLLYYNIADSNPQTKAMSGLKYQLYLGPFWEWRYWLINIQVESVIYPRSYLYTHPNPRHYLYGIIVTYLPEGVLRIASLSTTASLATALTTAIFTAVVAGYLETHEPDIFLNMGVSLTGF